MKGNRPQPGVAEAVVIDSRDLVGFTEIAERLGWSRNTVANWPVRHEDFPKPVSWLRMGRVYSWNAVLAWAESTGRQPW